MRLFHSILRLIVFAAFMAGLGLPATAHARASNAGHEMHHTHGMRTDALHAALPFGEDVTCIQHCLSHSILASPAAQPSKAQRLTAVFVALSEVSAPSLSPQPEGHPPRL